MEQIKKLSDQELITKTEHFSKLERHYAKLLLEHLLEIQERRLHLRLGYESVFAYCTRVLKFSENEALTRIGAMRLLQKIPEATKKIESGELTLTNANLLNGHLTRSGEEKSKTELNKLLADCTGISARKCKHQLEEASQKERGIAVSEVTVTLKVKASVLKKIEELKKLKGIGGDSDLIELLCEQELEKERVKVNANAEKNKKPSSKSGNEHSRAIPKKLREELLAEAGHRCTYISPLTGKRCESTSHLVVDHVLPWGWGGLTTSTNCRIICSNHNGLLARESFGNNKIDKFCKSTS